MVLELAEPDLQPVKQLRNMRQVKLGPGRELSIAARADAQADQNGIPVRKEL